MRLLPALLVLIVASCGGAPAYAGTSVAAGAYPALSVRVIDGDAPEARIGLAAGRLQRSDKKRVPWCGVENAR